jgi:hypothetical protein
LLAEEDLTADLATLTLAKTHDESCDVLDSPARAQFRTAVNKWVESLKEDDATKSRIRESFKAAGPNTSHNCAAMAVMNVPLWLFRDSRREDAQGQFRLMMKAKNFELKCHVLSSEGLQAFYKAGLKWIANSGAGRAEQSSMTADWQNANPSENADCKGGTLIDFMVTWPFRAAAAQ